MKHTSIPPSPKATVSVMPGCCVPWNCTHAMLSSQTRQQGVYSLSDAGWLSTFPGGPGAKLLLHSRNREPGVTPNRKKDFCRRTPSSHKRGLDAGMDPALPPGAEHLLHTWARQQLPGIASSISSPGNHGRHSPPTLLIPMYVEPPIRKLSNRCVQWTTVKS